MSRLDDVIRRARDLPSPPVACSVHATLVARVIAGDDAFDAFAEAVDCPDCLAAIALHPHLDVEALEMRLPMPVLDGWGAEMEHGVAASESDSAWARTPATVRADPGRSPLIVVAVVLAAAVLLLALGAREVSRTSALLARPGPSIEGRALYPYVPPVEGPFREGRALTPAAAPYRGRAEPMPRVEPALPIAWRYERRQNWR